MLTFPKCILAAFNRVVWYMKSGSEEDRDVVLMTDAVEQEETLRILFAVAGSRIQDNKKRREYQVITAQDWWSRNPDVLPRISIELNLMMEELGELAAAYNRNRLYDFKKELADMLILILGIGKGLDIDLAKELYQKMEENESRPVGGEKRF